MTPIPEDPLQRTRAHLKILGIVFIVLGALSLTGLGGVVLLNTMVDIMMAEGGLAEFPAEDAAMIRSLVRTMCLAFTLLILVHVFFHVLVGICLIKCKYYWPCYLTGVFTLLSFPLGTVLGVFTLVVLSRPEARELFGLAPRTTYPPVNA